jgi:tetratricopeptide (TPR) repeat protein
MFGAIRSSAIPVCLSALIAVLSSGCATNSGGDARALKDFSSSAWSVKGTDGKMAISVSPVRRTVQIAGVSAAIVGAAIDAAANSGYRSEIDKVLGGYDPGKVFEERLKDRLNEALPGKLEQVKPLESGASQQEQKDREKTRLQSVRRSGKQGLLDLKATFGIFGPEGTLVAKLDGELINVADAKQLWKNSVLASTEPIFANAPLNDPTKTMMPNLSNPRFSAEKDAIAQWTGDNGERFKVEYERSVDATIAALLCDLGLLQDASGEYFLGKLAMNRKNFEEADVHFRNALALNADLADAENGLANNLGHQKKYDEALEAGLRALGRFPDFGPLQFNIAWWYAIGKEDLAAARPYYEKAKSLGVPADSKLDKAFEDKGR